MRFMQIRAGQKLHIVYEPGEGNGEHVVRAGHIGHPLCGRQPDNPNTAGGYRLTINLPMGHSCKNCWRVFRARERGSKLNEAGR